METHMFELGELVATVEKGPPAQGIIRACYDSDFYSWAKKQGIKHLKWANKRDFKAEENYYTVEFPSPIRVITVQEIQTEFNWKYAESLEYLETLPMHKYLDFPEPFLSRIEY
jgi:hypothetical protein